jgi:thiamine-monophosphate kinase
MGSLKISDIGEKRLIKEFIRPLFNSTNRVEGVGDDCAMLDAPGGFLWLFSTDRVPADLIAFRLGILDYSGLGKYLARLNISDIVACGGTPLALLLNLGLPDDLFYDDFKSLCTGFGEVAESHGCQVLGGDITASRELSISATSIGSTKKTDVLTRRGAKKGDSIFITRPLGMTPAAFAYHLRCRENISCLTEEETVTLNRQFTSLEPLVSLGLILSASHRCGSCMDNTDGVGQSLKELSIASGSAFIVRAEAIDIPPLVTRIAHYLGEDPVTLAFSAGADFSLVGTLDGQWSQLEVDNQLSSELKIIGYVEEGDGVYMEDSFGRRPLQFSPWNYFLETT